MSVRLPTPGGPAQALQGGLVNSTPTEDARTRVLRAPSSGVAGGTLRRRRRAEPPKLRALGSHAAGSAFSTRSTRTFSRRSSRKARTLTAVARAAVRPPHLAAFPPAPRIRPWSWDSERKTLRAPNLPYHCRPAILSTLDQQVVRLYNTPPCCIYPARTT